MTTLHPRPARSRIGLARLWDALLDLIFPPRCAACGRVDTHWCADCHRALLQQPLELQYGTMPPFAGMLATAPHDGPLQHAIHALKYLGQVQIAHALGQRLGLALRAAGWPVTASVPVPLHASRLAERGYNQSELLCLALAEHSALPCLPQALTRARETRTQVGLNREGRLQNVAEAFSATAQVAGHHLLIIDDVRTTGATLSACAEAALHAGALSVYALTVSAAL